MNRVARALALGFSFVIPAGLACNTPAPKLPSPAGSASAQAGPPIDPSRADYELLKALAAVPDPGDVVGALDASSKASLQKLESSLDPQERARAARGDKGIVNAHPLIALDLGSDDLDALFTVAARGMASRELLFLKSYAQGNKPATELTGVADLSPVTRELAKRAAARLARIYLDQARASVRPLGATEADRIESIARVLGNPSLQRIAMEHAVKMDSSPRYQAWASSAASRTLDVDAARSHLSAAGSSTDESTRLSIERANNALERAEQIVRARKSKATGDQALDAATAALKSERFDIAKELLAQSGVAPEVRPSSRDRARSCLARWVALRRSRGCRTSTSCCVQRCGERDARVPKALDVLRRGLGSTRGRDPWSLEAYAGVVHVMPMIYKLGSGGVKNENDARVFFRKLFQDPRDVLVPGETLPKIRRDAFALFADSVSAAYTELEKNSTGTLKLSAELRTELRTRAEGLLKSGSNDPWVPRAVLAAMVVIASQEDPTPTLTKLVIPTELSTSLGMVLATSVVRYQHPELLSRARDLLHLHINGEAPAMRWRADVIADEVQVALHGEQRNIEALLSAINVEIPSDGGIPDRFHYAIDLMGLASRAGQQLDAEQVAEQVSNQLAQAADNSDAHDLRETIEAVIDAVTARSISSERRQIAIKRIEARFDKRTPSSTPEALYYSGIFWRALVDRDERAKCKPTDKACLGAVDEKLRKIDSLLSESAAAMNPSTVDMVKRGTFPLGGGAQFGINYSLEAGISPTLELTARMLILPPPKLTEVVETKPTPAKPGQSKPGLNPPAPKSPATK
ncbi:MAG: hypothetical protein U0165_06970 [Polyangiaceae bacterium]